MKKRTKQLLSLLLTGCMLISMAVGCGTSEQVASAGEGKEEVKAEESAEPEAEENVAEEPEEMAEIEVALLCLAPVDTKVQERVAAHVNEYLEGAINVHANIVWYDAANYMTQIPMMIQAGETLDVIMFTPMPATGYASLMSQGQLTDITDYVDTYGQDIKAVLGEAGLAATSKDGRIYGVGGQSCNYKHESVIIVKEALEAANMLEKFEEMDSWSDLEEILLAVKEAGYGGAVNTDVAGTVISPQPYLNGEDAFADAQWVDVVGDGNYQVFVDETTDQVECFYMNESYKKSILRAGDWYEKGLIYKDASTSEDFSDTQLKNGVGSCEVKQVEYGWDTILNASIGKEVVTKKIVTDKLATNTYTMFGFAVPITAQEPEAALKFINAMYSANEAHTTLQYGVEGIDWELKEDGTAGYVGDAESAEFHMNGFPGNLMDVLAWQGSEPNLRENQTAMNAEMEASKYMGFTIDNSEISAEVTAVQNVVNEYKPGLAAGIYGANTEAKYNEFVDALKAAGIEKVLETYQAQLDAWLGK